MVRCDMTYLLTAAGLSPGGSSTVHIYTQTIQRATQDKQYIEQNKHFGRVRAVPRLCGFYPGICLITDEKHGKTSVRVYIYMQQVGLLHCSVILNPCYVPIAASQLSNILIQYNCKI